MRKAVKLKAVLWVEGDDEPAHDFAWAAIEMVKRIVRRADTGAMRLRLQRIAEDRGHDDEPEPMEDAP